MKLNKLSANEIREFISKLEAERDSHAFDLLRRPFDDAIERLEMIVDEVA